MNQPEIIIMNKSKQGPKPAPIKPMIHWAELKEDCLDCSLASGGKLNLRPDALDELIFDKTGVRAEAITRTTLYIDENGEKIRPEKSEARI